MANQEFKTPQDALAHYGKKGMHWGVRKEDEPGGDSGGKASRPKEESVHDLGKVMDEFYSKKSPEELKAEGQKKLKEQAANQDFPPKGARQQRRDRKAEELENRAAEVDAIVTDLKTQRDALAPGFRTAYKRSALKSDIKTGENARDGLQNKAEKLRAGKLTNEQKLLIGAGALAATAVLATYGQRQYALHQAGMTSAAKKRAAAETHAANTEQWRTLFGEHHDFKPAASHLTASNSSFFSGLTNKKALDRPEFTIPKGTEFQRLSNHPEDSSEYGKVKGAYASFLQNDKKLYSASSEFGNKKYAISFQAKDDVRVPTVSTVLAHLKQIKEQEFPGSPNNTPEKIYQEYHSMSGGSWSDSTSMKLFSSLKQFGYSAIVDDMDAGYLGDLPVVFFGDAEPATATPRPKNASLRDSVGVLKLSGKYA